MLKQTQARIYCLVRADNIEQGSQRIEENLKRYLLWNSDYRSRIIPFIGDLSQPLFGLSKQAFQHLASQVDVIYHAGAIVNFIYSYAQLKSTNVLGTQEILRLATSGVKLKPVHHISTYSIFFSQAYSSDKVIREQDDLRDGNGIYIGYSQSKWVAEKLVLEARSRGIPVCIYRLGDITGHSQTGAFNQSSFTTRMIASCIQLGRLPDRDMNADITPIDYSVQAVVHLSRQKESLGKTFHLVNPQPIHWETLFNLVQAQGYPLQKVSYTQWHANLLEQMAHSSSHLLSPFLPFLSNFENQQSIFERLAMSTLDCQNTLEGLAETSIQCPPVNEALLNTYFSYFVRSSFLQKSPD